LIKINTEGLVILFAQKRKKKPTAYIPLLLLLLLLFHFACIVNSKTGVEFHKIFQCGKEFHRLKLLAQTRANGCASLVVQVPSQLPKLSNLEHGQYFGG